MQIQPETGTPVAQGNYVVAKRHRDIVYTSGMTPRFQGALVRTGTVTCDDDLNDYKEAVELATSNALKAAGSVLGPGERLSEVLTMTVFIAASQDFREHSRLADFASNFLLAKLGEEAVGTRAAVGVSSLPGGSMVEIQMTVIVSL
ncbi:RidA family protein [Rhizobium lusitanum]|uniref:RidA family protein n=1 Tax=Rhizobium lusitanum TaxID=293958 RepID=UPI00195CA258|nr:RidA family protein [Rhizobium lusitanum]MBM7045504.1 RidA family protein [Rhizobium lusitanum]